MSSTAYADDRKRVKEWLLRVILKKAFGGTPDNIYPVLRKLINESIGQFPLNNIIEHYRGHVKSIIFTDDDIDNLLNVQYGTAFAFSALSLLYDGLNMSFQYHQDHIHPKKFFNGNKLHSLGVPVEELHKYLGNYNTLGNLQLIEAIENLEKNATPITEWLDKTQTNEFVLKAYKAQHFIPLDVDLDLISFPLFAEERKKLIKSKFQQILNIEKQTPIEQE